MTPENRDRIRGIGGSGAGRSSRLAETSDGRGDASPGGEGVRRSWQPSIHATIIRVIAYFQRFFLLELILERTVPGTCSGAAIMVAAIGG